MEDSRTNSSGKGWYYSQQGIISVKSLGADFDFSFNNAINPTGRNNGGNDSIKGKNLHSKTGLSRTKSAVPKGRTNSD